HGLRGTTANLPFDHAGMQDVPAVVGRYIAVDAYLAGDAVDLGTAKIEDEAMAERRVDLVGVDGCRQLRRRPEHRLPDCVAHLIGKQSRRPMAYRRKA